MITGKDALRVERVHAGQLPATDDDKTALDDLYRDDQLVRLQLRRLPAASRPSSWRPALVGLVAAAAMAVIVVRPSDGMRTKGEAEAVAPLQVFERVGGEVIAVRDGSHRGAGSLLQLVVQGPAAHAAVVSMDGRGQVTWHWPIEGGASALPPGTTALPQAYELDDAPLFERFVLVRSEVAIDHQAIVKALQQAHSQAIVVAGSEVSMLVILK